MNRITKQNLAKQLEECQKLARVRKVSESQVLTIAGEIEKFLRRAPNGTSVKSNWSRVANSYVGVPEGTFVRGTRSEDGTISLEVLRGSGAFGNREYTISRPNGWKITGHDAHPSSGATDDLAATKMVAL